MTVRRSGIVFGLVAVLTAAVMVRLVRAPTYTDAFYHFNAAVRFAQGDGLTDTYLWTYLGAPDRIGSDGTFPSHLYWMPAASLIAGAAMALVGAPGDHAAAQLPSIPMLAAVGCVGFWLGLNLGGTLRAAWLVGLISLFNGFFARYWGAIETFTPYAFFGSLALLSMGIGIRRLRAGRSALAVWLLCGLFCGAAHLTRNDGLLLLPVAFFSIVLAALKRHRFSAALMPALSIAIGYGLVMGPWMVRNLSAIGSPLPFGGTQAIWFTEYNELFNFPPDANPGRLLAAGLWETRRDAIGSNLMTFIAVEGLIVMTPFMLLGLWRRRSDPLIQPFALYALGLHLVMTLVFPFPGYRGGLFHSAAALIPFWAALGVDGLDAAVNWFGRKRRWRIRQAQMIFGTALLGCAVVLTLNIAARSATTSSADAAPPLYRALLDTLPPDSRVLVNDPAQLYYFTGLGGAVLPNETPDIIPIIAERYAVTHVLIELDAQGQPLTPLPFASIISSVPEFLDPVPLNIDSARLYAIRAPASTD
ncbi:MAG: hypothetical protein ACUVS2_13425 [Candidatus Flexifilum sp.]|jgi:hypothetical protein